MIKQHHLFISKLMMKMVIQVHYLFIQLILVVV